MGAREGVRRSRVVEVSGGKSSIVLGSMVVNSAGDSIGYG